MRIQSLVIGGVLWLLFLLYTATAHAQSDPAAQSLPYSFTTFSGSTLPAGMAAHRFGTTAGAIPLFRTTASGNADLPMSSQANAGGWRSEGASGISLLASGTNAAGAIIVAVNATGLSSISVSWRAGTVMQQASRDNSVALQYRVGTAGNWIDVGTTSTYTSAGAAEGSVSGLFTETLPAAANNKPVVQVRWIYWESVSTSGSRDRINIDDISITGSSACPPNTPAVSLGPDVSYCAGTPFSLVLNAQNPGASYNWKNGASTAQTFTVTQAGTYIVKVTDANGCINSDTLTVTQKALPVVQLGNDVSYCAGIPFSLVLNAQNPGAAYSWNGGTSTAQTYTATQAGTYTVTVTGTNGCQASDALTVTENPLPVVDLGNDTAYCAGNPFLLVLDARNNGSAYSWNGGTSTAQTRTATQAGTYTVTVTDANGCQATEALTVTENPLPVVDLGNDTAYCAGTPISLALDAQNNGAAYSWNGGTSTARTYTATQAGTYTVTVTDQHGCTGTDALTVTENTVPAVHLGNDVSYCEGSTFQLTLDAQNTGSAYVWNGGGLTSQVFVVPQPGTYWVVVTRPNGCSAADSVTVGTLPRPAINIGNNASFCQGVPFSLLLDAQNPTAAHVWNTGALTQTLTVSQPGTYSVTVTDSNGCSNSASVTISTDAVPAVHLGNDTAYCAGTPFSLVLNAQNPGSAYLWNGGTNAQTLQVTHAGTYSVSVTGTNGCTGHGSITVTEHTAPVVNLGNDMVLPQNGQVLDAGSGFSAYLWQPGGQTTRQITATQPGTYTVTVTDANGCTASDAITLTLDQTSVPEAGVPVSLNVYPNPSDGLFQLTWGTDGPVSVDVISINGQRLYTHKTTATEGQNLALDLSRLAPGLYVLQVSGTAGTAVQRIVISR